MALLWAQSLILASHFVSLVLMQENREMATIPSAKTANLQPEQQLKVDVYTEIFRRLIDSNFINRNSSLDCFVAVNGSVLMDGGSSGSVVIRISVRQDKHEEAKDTLLCENKVTPSPNSTVIAVKWRPTQTVLISSIITILIMFFIAAAILRVKNCIKRNKERRDVTKRVSNKKRSRLHLHSHSHSHHNHQHCIEKGRAGSVKTSFLNITETGGCVTTGGCKADDFRHQNHLASRSVPRIATESLLGPTDAPSSLYLAGSTNRHSYTNALGDLSAGPNASSRKTSGSMMSKLSALEDLPEKDTVGGQHLAIRSSPHNQCTCSGPPTVPICPPPPPAPSWGSRKKFTRRHSLTEEIDSVLHKHYRNRPPPPPGSVRSRSSNNISAQTVQFQPGLGSAHKTPLRMMSLTANTLESTSGAPAATKRSGKMFLVRGPGSLRITNRSARDPLASSSSGPSGSSRCKLERRATITAHRPSQQHRSAFHKPQSATTSTTQKTGIQGPQLSTASSSIISFPMWNMQREIENYCVKSPTASERKTSNATSQRDTPSPRPVAMTNGPRKAPHPPHPQLSKQDSMLQEEGPRTWHSNSMDPPSISEAVLMALTEATSPSHNPHENGDSSTHSHISESEI